VVLFRFAGARLCGSFAKDLMSGAYYNVIVLKERIIVIVPLAFGKCVFTVLPVALVLLRRHELGMM
jgi:hypothetical protein